MDIQNAPVTGQVDLGAGTPPAGTPATETGGAPLGAGATPSGQNDEIVRKQIAEAVQKYEDDIRKLKSTFDRREAQRQQEAAKREEEFNRKLQELEMRGMDEETRKKYEASHRDEEFQRLVKEKQEYQSKLQEVQQSRDYEKFFLDSGVPAGELILDQGIEALAESGWKALRKLVGTLQEENKRLKSGSSAGSDLPEPPQTINHTSQTPAKLSIADAAKKYAGGDEDRLYQMIEKGNLSPNVLNLPKE